MASPQIKIRTEGFRAIGNAEIIIDGITIVAGENGCGKSTISKLLYYLYKTASNYDSLILKELKNKLRDLDKFFDILIHELSIYSKDRDVREKLRRELSELWRHNEVSIKEIHDKWISLLEKSMQFYKNDLNLSSSEKDKFSYKSRSRRLRHIIEDILKLKPLEESNGDEIPFNQIREFIEATFKEALGKSKSRPSSLFIDELKGAFSSRELPKVFEVIEYEEEIASLNKSNLSIPFAIQSSIYIDTPMAFLSNNFNYNHWQDLNELLNKSGHLSFSELSDSISAQVINGETAYDNNSNFSDKFVYKRNDGSTFNLLDCATGVKSFAILQLLLKNGSLNDKTLLIIDEPESHLHPQWIIEYARLLVLLNKVVGVKFFIASHNPDMVSAIKYISEKEGISSNVNFYLAEKRKGKYVYDYKHLALDIDPIFASFNIALERIHQYGS